MYSMGKPGHMTLPKAKSWSLSYHLLCNVATDLLLRVTQNLGDTGGDSHMMAILMVKRIFLLKRTATAR